MKLPRCPTASYRFQLTPDFGFDAAVELFETLMRLGVSHVYLSPIAEAVEGSQHGYDVVDHTRVRDEFGGRRGLERLLDAASDSGLGVIVDHVPNHVSVARPDANPMWWRMLAEGPSSGAAAFFDVDWQAAGGKVLIPQLGRPIGEMLADGDIEMHEGPDGHEVLVGGSLRFPLRTGTESLALADALDQQHYRLQWWRDPARNVRRFFTIDELVAVRVEVAGVAEHVDTLPQELTGHGAFAGVRVDHVDGLADPLNYLQRLRERIGDRLLLVEKILAPGETLPESWPVDGTTGYEHITVVEHTLLDPQAHTVLMQGWADLAGHTPFHDLERAARREVLDDGLAPDLDRLLRTISDPDAATDTTADTGNDTDTTAGAATDTTADTATDTTADTATDTTADTGTDTDTTAGAATDANADTGTGTDRHADTGTESADAASGDSLDSTSAEASTTREAVILLTLELKRYRTYLPDPESAPVFRELVERAVGRADDSGLRAEIQRVADVLVSAGNARTRWQQLSGPVMAKGAEDRAFYRFFPLASLSEVGGTPGEFSTPIDAFHRHQIVRSENNPVAMLASTTHDTKRSAGVRSRSLALAARAGEWQRMIAEWIDANADALGTTDRRFVSLALQTAVTARPLTVTRLHDYLVKSAREGDEITSWIEPDEECENALEQLADLAIEASEHGGDLAAFADEIDTAGAAVGLRMLVLQLTCPGFADLYQGSPMSLLSLVDPDNRVPPSWARLRHLIDDVSTTDTETAFNDSSVDLARTTLTERVLRLRRRRPTSFDERSGYRELALTGPDAEHVIAYARTEPAADGEDDEPAGTEHEPTVVVIVTRARSAATGDPETRVELPAGTWRSIVHDDARIVDGGATRLSDVLSAAEFVVLDRTDR